MQARRACADVRVQMFAQGTQRFAAVPGATPAAAPPSQNGTLDEPVSDTLKRDLLRCATTPLTPRTLPERSLTCACVDFPSTRRVARNVRAVLLPGLKGTAGAEVRAAATSYAAARWGPEAACGTLPALETLTRCTRAAQALRDWDLWGPLIFTMTLVRPSCSAARVARRVLRRCCRAFANWAPDASVGRL
jgi:hypothetical protein